MTLAMQKCERLGLRSRPIIPIRQIKHDPPTPSLFSSALCHDKVGSLVNSLDFQDSDLTTSGSPVSPGKCRSHGSNWNDIVLSLGDES
ncbi:hypothetical protein L6164_013756 [Bauhinia variegata]|uniref:Uncharacterized protein n=1 Tax=Bauhinia variegata TaxID=167791 RepID=A0ACB9NK19_BAUVA|nr:hypothetical protein L6164_013756 [Bauhinia variegata]